MREIVEQYRIVAGSAGWLERADRGRLRIDGSDAVAFLQALITNDVASIGRGDGVYAAHLTPQGRMLADMVVHHCGEYLLLDVAASAASELSAKLDALVFTEDVRVADASSELAQLTVFGATAAPVLAHAFGLEAVEPDRLATLPVRAHVDVGGVLISRSDEIDLPSFDVFFPVSMRDAAVARLKDTGAAASAPELLDALRIEAGRPAFGRDMDEETIPLEAGLLERAISTSKGCYVGQEIVIRILHRGGGRVARRLVKLVFDDSASGPPNAGALLMHDGQSVGRITSAAISPRMGNVVALGYVHRDHAHVGTTVGIADDGREHTAEIVGFAG